MAAAAGQAVPAALDERLLNQIFNGLPEREPSDSQGESLPFLKLYVHFARSDVGLSAASVAALDALAHGREATTHDGDTSVSCEFFPEYGCALVFFTALGCAAELTTRLKLLGLDGWTWDGVSGGHFAATAGAPTELDAGSVSASELANFRKRLNKLLEDVRKRTGEARSAANSKQGHQRTPAMILCLVEQAIAGDGRNRLPRGGLTDVGLHTGGRQRATAWPLAAAVIRLVVEQLDASSDQPTYESLLPLWELWLAEQALDAAAPGRKRIVDVGDIASMLHSSVCRAVPRCLHGHVMPADFEKRVIAVRTGVEALQREDLERAAAAAAYKLPPLVCEGGCIDGQQPSLPVLLIPPPPDAQSEATDLANARKRAFKNLRWVPLPPGLAASASAMAEWLRLERVAPANGAPRMSPHLRAEATECWIFNAAVTLLPVESAAESADQVEDAMQSLVAVLKAYRDGIEHALAANAGGRLLTELRSRETLACWTVACLADWLAGVDFPLLRKYHMALNFADLRHLSLSDGLALDALHAVCAYLRSRTNGGALERPLFSLLPRDKTVEFAAATAGKLDEIVKAWDVEQRHAAGRRDAHWAEVQKKRAQVETLRAQLKTAESAVADAKLNFDKAPHCALWPFASNPERAANRVRLALEQKLQACRATESDLKQKLAAALTAPALVTQPLPSDHDRALAVLFFLYMPTVLRMLSQLSFEAQAALMPRPLRQDECKADGVDKMTWDWKRKHADLQDCEFYKFSPAVRETSMGSVELKSKIDLPKATEPRWPKTVDDMSLPEHGVWHPDAELFLYWKGLDPWKPVSRKRMRDFYTPQLPERWSSEQWALSADDCGATASERGNMAVGAQADRPDWLSKPQYLAFAGVRAFGHMQLRKLACALRERSLPLSHEAVQVLLRGALHQLGPLRTQPGDERTFMPWKADLAQGPLLDALHHALTGLADELADRISEHGSLLALLDVLAYLSAWEPASDRLRALRARCADIARGWNKATEEQVAHAVDPAALPSLRARQCVFAMYGIFAHAGSDALSDDEAASLLCFAVMSHDGYVYQADASPPGGPEAFAALRSRCEAVMASREEALVAVARAMAADGGSALTAALKCVHKQAPPQLAWTELEVADTGTRTGCFEAVTPDGHLYSMNVLTGLVLLDGSPPRSLPADVLAHPLYQRTFGHRDFEVCVTGAGALRTVRPLAGWLYEFFMHSDGKLSVKELPQKSEDAAPVLELLDGTPDGVAEWGAELPIRLRELHSHWLCRASNALFVRDTCLPLRRVAFVGLLGEAPTAMDDARTSAAARCFRVPLHLGDRPASELIALALQGKQLCEVLQLWPAGAPVPALTKFEAEPLMHWYRNESSGDFRVELPRYRLEFELKPGSGELASKDYNEFNLAHCEQLSDALPGLSCYLLLEPAASLLAQPPWDAPPFKMVVPAGTVKRGDGGCVHVVGDDAPGAARGTWTFDAHARFGELRAHSVAARLHLAALHAASDTGVPEPRTGLTGAELALEDVRRSFINRPPSAEEQERCDNVAALSRSTPALHLACAHWSDSARQVAFLYPEVEVPPRAAGVHSVADSSMAYKHYVLSSGSCAKLRLKLSPAEEKRVLGTLTGAPLEERDRIAPVQESVVLLKPPVDASYVTEAEARLSALVSSSKPKKELPFPLAISADATASDALGKEMHEELRASWAAKQRLELHKLAQEPHTLLEQMQTELAAATMKRVAAQAYLMDAAAAEPAAEASEPLRRAAAAVRLRRASGALPPPSLPQLARVLLDPDAALPAISPLLASSAVDKSRFKSTTRTWMQLCVLEDKLTRLTRMAAAAVAADGDADASASVCADIVRELRTTRKWDAAEHPEWLAFELDGALQIRPAQHELAKAVLEHAERKATEADEPGPILQLNMGEGKTRVIVPMLMLQWARQRKHVRLNVLPQLLSEAYDHLHAHLTGGLLATQLFLLPFHRDVQVTPQRAAVLLAHAEYARRQGGALLVTPESRLSMHLKQRELRAAATGSGDPYNADAYDAAADKLERIEALPWHDVYDESDALLRVKLQLVYAVGSPGALPYLQKRAAALAALLRALRDDPTASALLAVERIAVRSLGPPGAFLATLRLLPGTALDDALPRLHEALAAAVLRDPPHELRWLLHARYKGASRDAVMAYVTDTSQAADDIIAPEDFGCAEHRAALLALRGFLAHGVLAHALRQRHRVDYGVAPPGPGRRKRLAVPFRACDVPALRAEFAHPDAALALTTVSYYYSGLSDDEVLDAFTTLLSLGETEQAARYNEWHSASAPGMAPSDAASVDGVRKLDLSNVLQRALLCKAYTRCVPLIDFWLQARVLPSETTQYPQRLRATAWDMRCPNAKAAAGGFSGTNDQHRLLPLHVRQQPLPDAQLQATDGHMLALVLDKARYEALPAPAAGEPAWQAVLRFAVRRGCVALMDAGALLAGVDLAGAAKYTLELLHEAGSDLQAVAYFDTGSGHAGEWVLADQQDGWWPKPRAPMTERDAFVIFDEARCRGADMRLRRDARALLTLGPRMGKDKLMQAAGRLRQLDRGQSLLLTALRDVHDAILATAGKSADVTVQAALTWVMSNTMAASRAGLLEWAVNGLHHAVVQSDPAKALGDEKLSLEAFYAAAATPQDVGALVQAHAEARKAAGGASVTILLARYMDKVVERAAKYGSGTLIAASTLDEECERELEQEEEQEQEIEVEAPRRAPRAETDWPVAAAAALQHADAGAMRLADAVANHLRPPELATIAWSPAVWVTANFIRTLAPPDGASADDEHDDLSLYQRPVDAMLRLPDGGVLLLSDREAETLLEAHWAAGKAAGRPPLLHHSYARDARDAALMAPDNDDDDDAALPDELAAALQLFNGETTLGGEARVAAAVAMLPNAEARGAALRLPVLRGNAHLLARSHLEACCEAKDDGQQDLPSAKKRKRTPEAHSAGAASPSSLAKRTAHLRINPSDAGGGSSRG